MSANLSSRGRALLGTCLILATWPHRAFGDVGVAAGNSSGLSSEVFDNYLSSENVHRIIPPSSLTAVRLDKDKVLLTWTATATTKWKDSAGVEHEAPNTFQIFRAFNDDAWSVIASAIAGSTTTYTDAAAPPGRYRYRVAAVCDALTGAASQISHPSPEAVLDHVQATLKPAVGRTSGTLPGTAQTRSAKVDVSPCIPEVPNPVQAPGILTFDGPLADTWESDPPGYGYYYYKEIIGWLPRGEPITLSYEVRSLAPSYADDVLGFDMATAPHTPLPVANLVVGEGFRLKGNGAFTVFTGAFSPELPFDAATNPKTLLLATGQSRKIALATKPNQISQGVHLAAPGFTMQPPDLKGSGIFTVTAPANTVSSALQATVEGQRIGGIDVVSVPLRTVHVGFYRVFLKMPDGTIVPASGSPEAQKLDHPNVAEIQAVLDAVYLKGANLKVVLHARPDIQVNYDVTKADTLLCVDQADEVQTVMDISSLNTGDKYAVFYVSKFGLWSGSGDPYHPGGVAGITQSGSKRGAGYAAFVQPWIGARDVAHEIGHLMGLPHPWTHFTDRPSTGTTMWDLPDDSNERVMGYGSLDGYRLTRKEWEIVRAAGTE